MRIIMIVDSAPPLYGGAGRQALLLAKQLEMCGGYNVSIWARRQQRSVKGRHGIVTFLGPFIRNETLSNAAFAFMCGLRLLFSRVDVVHVHGAFYYGFTSILVARLRRKPSLLKITLVGVDDPTSVGLSTWFGLPIGRLNVRQFALATCVIALNNEAKRVARTTVPPDRIRVIPNGVVVPTVLRDRSGDIAPRVAFVGVFSERKGADTLLSAWTNFQARYPLSRLDVYGPIEYRPYDGIPTDDRSVVFHGQVSPEEVFAGLESTNVFVLPSRAEGLPNAAIEAMSHQLPMVLSEIPVNLSTAHDAAVYFDPESSQELSDALAKAWEQRARLSERSALEVSTFEMEGICAKYDALYREIGSRNEK